MTRTRQTYSDCIDGLIESAKTVATVAVTAWIVNWVAVAIEPSHTAFYSVIIAAFLLTTTRALPHHTA
jgi:hypothetical protein